MLVPLNSVRMCSASADQLLSLRASVGVSLVQHKPGFGPLRTSLLISQIIHINGRKKVLLNESLPSNYLAFLSVKRS